MKSISKQKLIKQNRALRNIVVNKKNNSKGVAISVLDVYVEELKKLLEQQLIQLNGRIALSDATNSIEEKSFFIGASEQLNNVTKIIDKLHITSLQAIKEMAVGNE